MVMRFLQFVVGIENLKEKVLSGEALPHEAMLLVVFASESVKGSDAQIKEQMDLFYVWLQGHGLNSGASERRMEGG